ncbi:MAG: alpha/beta hydrolase [Rhodothermaceae bacterium]|nr:alpha/beta hydrolase [Rhodothermaceae bacterium]
MTRRVFLFVLLAAVVVPAPQAQVDLSGDWGGAISGVLPLVLHIEAADDGFTASLDSPTQGAFGIPVGEVLLDGLAVTFTFPVLPATYSGQLDATLDTLTGVWNQGGVEQPLTFVRGAEATGPNRPQEPQPPFPYATEDVAFMSADGTVLAGTLTIPAGNGPHRAVVLTSGSGPQNRDEELAGHKPFFVLADYLTRQGLLVLRYDDRGVGESSGSFETADLYDFTADATAAVEFLNAREEVADVGLLGHSEGGYVAPLVAKQTETLDFIVLLAGPSVRGAEVLEVQNELAYRLAGVSPETAEAYATALGRVLQRIIAVPLDQPLGDELLATARDSMRATITALPAADLALAGVREDNLDQVLAGLADFLQAPWARAFLAYDPQPDLRALDVPTLALFGAKDFQVPPDQNEEPMRAALAASNSPLWDVETFEGLNHLFQTAPTGSMGEYGTIEETMNPAVLARIADWIASLE